MSLKSYPLLVGTGMTVVDIENQLVTPMNGQMMLMNVGAEMLRNGNDPYHPELQYLALLAELLDKHDADPTPREDRTGTGTFSVFGRQMRFDLKQGFPLLTTKKLFTKGIVAELLWMLSGETNAKPLQEQGVHIWDEWCDDQCNLGPIYGEQWRSWKLPHDNYHDFVADYDPPAVDQIAAVIKSLQEKPNDRGHIVSAWNVADLKDMRLRPCHVLFQFYVENGSLSCQLYQRSADIFLGVPFNIASYALLTHLIAREVGLDVGDFVHTFGDLHLYSNHVEQAREQLTRTPRPLPEVLITNDAGGIFEVKPENIQFGGYDPHPAIKAEVSV